MNKDDIRRRVKAHKALLDDVERATAAAKVFALLEKTAAFVMARNILMYHSLPDELSTHDFLDKWAGRKSFFLPRVNGVDLDILPYDRAELKLGAFNIEEPTGEGCISIGEMDMVIVPAVAYDRRGNRVGRGKGYYDSLLADTSATRIGIAYDFQLVDEIDVEPHDVGVDMVITDTRLLYTRNKKQR